MQFLCLAETKLKASGIVVNMCSQLLAIIPTYLGVDFSYNGAWDTRSKKLIQNCKKKVNQLHSIISNHYINLNTRNMLLLSVVCPSLEYGSEVWEGNKSQKPL